MQNITTFLHILSGALHDYGVTILIVVFILAVLATLVCVVWDLAAWEQRQHDRHESATSEASDMNERKAA